MKPQEIRNPEDGSGGDYPPPIEGVHVLDHAGVATGAELAAWIMANAGKFPDGMVAASLEGWAAALAAERRATVERIRAAMLDVHSYEQSNGIGVFPVDDLERILDDEAAR